MDLTSKWMIGLTSLEVLKSIFNITEENNNLDFYRDIFHVYSQN